MYQELRSVCIHPPKFAILNHGHFLRLPLMVYHIAKADSVPGPVNMLYVSEIVQRLRTARSIGNPGFYFVVAFLPSTWLIDRVSTDRQSRHTYPRSRDQELRHSFVIKASLVVLRMLPQSQGSRILSSKQRSNQ
ncbi:hypothetical protein E4U22_007916 [Claviceps purpurea]|nr:hypothetical protein E4U22_007916 [Claviceps purpurea]